MGNCWKINVFSTIIQCFNFDFLSSDYLYFVQFIIAKQWKFPICFCRGHITWDCWPWVMLWRTLFSSKVMRFVDTTVREKTQKIFLGAYLIFIHNNVFISINRRLTHSGDWQLASLCPWPQKQGQCLDDRLWQDNPCARNQRTPA